MHDGGAHAFGAEFLDAVQGRMAEALDGQSKALREGLEGSRQMEEQSGAGMAYAAGFLARVLEFHAMFHQLHAQRAHGAVLLRAVAMGHVHGGR